MREGSQFFVCFIYIYIFFACLELGALRLRKKEVFDEIRREIFEEIRNGKGNTDLLTVTLNV